MNGTAMNASQLTWSSFVLISKDNKNMPQKIDELISELQGQSKNTKVNLNIMQILSLLKPLLNEFEDFKNTISDYQSHSLYLEFHRFIKNQKQQIHEISAESIQAYEANDQNKLKTINNEVMNMMQSTQTIFNSVYKEAHKHILWIDKNLTFNMKLFDTLKEASSHRVTINCYNSDEKFRVDLLNLKDHPLILIMSASSAGSDFECGDGGHLQYVLSKKNQLKLRGIIIFCQERGEMKMKELQNDPNNMIYQLVTAKENLIEHVERLLIPLDFQRVVPLKLLDCYLSQQIKEEVLNWSLQDWSKYNLLDYASKQFEKMFSKAKQLILEKQIRIHKQTFEKMESIPAFIAKIFATNNTQQDLSKAFLSLYSKQDEQCYSFLNSVLNIVNDDLIHLLKDFIYLFLISLYQFNDSQKTIIKKPETGLNPIDLPYYEFYRGTSMPTDFINNHKLEPGQFITLPSFSSFTIKEKTAKNFMSFQKKFGDCTLLLLYYKFQTGTRYYDLRPKCIKEVSNSPNEEEYLIYPFTNFWIKSVEKRSEYRLNYLFVELGAN